MRKPGSLEASDKLLQFLGDDCRDSSQMVSEGTLLPLQRADGSASYSWNGYSVLAAVNGPVDVQRRDELPEESAVDVIVRPAAGIGGEYNFSITMLISFSAKDSKVYGSAT